MHVFIYKHKRNLNGYLLNWQTFIFPFIICCLRINAYLVAGVFSTLRLWELAITLIINYFFEMFPKPRQKATPNEDEITFGHELAATLYFQASIKYQDILIIPCFPS